ncbi:MAG: hypothetical protein ABL933_14230 [Methyloglobulus sp.]|nr:hypothetical protein [Methyloglobulus sp.]
MTKIELTNEDIKNLKIIIEHLSDSEKKSYEEYIFNDFEDLLDENSGNFDFIFSRDFYNRPEINHIYAITRRASDAINSNFIENSI